MTVPFRRPSRILPRTVWFALGAGIFSFAMLPVARAQAPAATPPAPPADTSQNAPKPDAKNTNDEIVAHDSPATFKVRVNLVLVRVVVRDNNGKVISNLKKEDFQLADNRKPQIISSFSEETPASHVIAAKTDSPESTSEGAAVKALEPPQRFVALYFDDLHLSTQDVMVSRQAATKLFNAMQAADRFAIGSTSGQVQQDFTADRGKLEEAVQRILPHSLTQKSAADCPPMTLYEAHMLVDVHDPDTIQVANQDLMNCSGNLGPGATSTVLSPILAAAASMVLNLAEAEEQRTYQALEALIRRMSVLPGQRVIVMMSPGFFVLPSMHQSAGEVIDRATKENVVINTIDARGLWVSSANDASTPAATASVSPLKTQYAMQEEESHYISLAELADGTGGVFFHDRNDIDQGLLHAATEPEVSYVLGFTPQNLKLDGKYHNLKVTLTGKQKWALQARHGYFAPRGEANPEAAAKEEIQQAVFSQEEMRELPIECQAQFFTGADGVHLSVVTHVGTEELKFRKVDERNQDTLTITTAIFDENGTMLTGLQRVLDMRLKDATLERVNKTGLNVKLSFDLQPGTFLIRTVVRDSEGAQMGAANREVVIPLTMPAQPARGGEPPAESEKLVVRADDALSLDPVIESVTPEAFIERVRYANAHPYVDMPLTQLVELIPELKTLQPAADQRELPVILQKMGLSVDEFARDIGDLIAHEDVTQEKLNAKGGIQAKEDVQDNYLILHHGTQWGASAEYRMDEKGNRLGSIGLQKGYLVTTGFALSCISFSTDAQSQSRFRYLGEAKVGSRDAYVLGFAQKPGEATFLVKMMGTGGAVVDMLTQGILWVDKNGFQIIRLRSDLLAPNREIQLLTTDETFGEVQLQDVPNSVWLPRDVNVYMEINKRKFRNEHHYTNYRRYRVSVKIGDQQKP